MKGTLLACVIAALGASASTSSAAPAEDKDGFWASMVSPHADEIALILKHARELRTGAMQFVVGVDFGYPNPYNDTQRDQKLRRYADAYGMLRYAVRELDADHPEVLYELGRTADDLGRYADALTALRSFIAHAKGSDHRLAEAHVRLGLIRARRGQWDESIDEFRLALASPGSGLQAQALIYLGCAYMHADRMAEAVDALEQAAGTSPYTQMYYVAQTAQFALAIAYDRDEQITRSHEVLERLLAADAGLNYAFGQPSYDYTGNGIDTEPLLLPPAERHYFMAFRYEAINQLDEARAEWQAYIRAAEDSPFRARARAHVEDIDRMRDEQMNAAANAKAGAATPPAVHVLGGTP